MFIPEKEKLILNEFKIRKIMTNIEIAEFMNCSISSVKKLRNKWKTYTSYNKNGKYFVLPEIPQFNKYGIWKYKGILFSKHGTLRDVLIAIVRNSLQGLKVCEIRKILGMNTRSFMHHYRNIPGLYREIVKKNYVYFSDAPSIYKMQKKNRLSVVEIKKSQLPSDYISIFILVDMIKHPGSNSTNINRRLIKENIPVSKEMIENLILYYGLEKKRQIFDSFII